MGVDLMNLVRNGPSRVGSRMRARIRTTVPHRAVPVAQLTKSGMKKRRGQIEIHIRESSISGTSARRDTLRQCRCGLRAIQRRVERPSTKHPPRSLTLKSPCAHAGILVEIRFR